MTRKALGKLEQGLMTLLLAGMILLVFAQIVCRYLHSSFSFTEEINQQLFIWVTMLGIALAVRRRELLGLQLLSRSVPGRRRRVLSALGLLALLAYGLFMAGSSLQMVWTQFQTGKTTPAMGWPIWLIGIAVPVGFLLVIIRAVEAHFSQDPEHGREALSHDAASMD